MNWTKLRPVKEGWYWIKFRENTKPHIVEVGYLITGDHNTLCARFSNLIRISDKSLDKSLWYGPIPEPKYDPLQLSADEIDQGIIDNILDSTDKTVKEWMENIVKDAERKEIFDPEYFFPKEPDVIVKVKLEKPAENITINLKESKDDWAEKLMKGWRDEWFAERAGKILADSAALRSGILKDQYLRWAIKSVLWDHFGNFNKRNGYTPELDVVVDEWSFRCVWDDNKLKVGSFCDKTQVKSPYIEDDSDVQVRLV